ncbi:MAG: DNA adenine methylase [Fimbriimonadaceae bacterium]
MVRHGGEVLIKYLGSKRTLVDDIVAISNSFPLAKSAIDLFSGTARVGHALKSNGYQVFSNDHNAYAHTLATCYVEADLEKYSQVATNLIAELNLVAPSAGYFTQTFCLDSRFFQPFNGEKVDAIRERIERMDLDPVLKCVLLVSLMEAADRVDSTCGVQMAYLKQWASRSYNPLELRLPRLAAASAHGHCKAIQMEAISAAEELQADIAYLDPPYNQHSYLGNYHVWESLVLWDKPEVYGIACKRVDCKTRSSIFNSRKRFAEHFGQLLGKLNSNLIIVSFNNEGYLSQEDLESMLGKLGVVTTVIRDFKRYVGAQIGIHNLKGEKVGTVSHLRNKELIYVCDRLSDSVSEGLRRLQSGDQSSLFELVEVA